MYHRTSSGQNSSSGSPYAMKVEDRSPGETERQQRCVWSKAWNLAKHIYKLKEKEDKAAFYSPSEEWIMPAASTINPKEREFVVDSGASMHMVSKRDFNKAELETVRISKNPTMVMTASGEVPAKEEATVYVRELDLFVTVMFLENTLAVLSLGILCEEFGYCCHWTSGQKPHLIKKSKKFHCDTSNHVPFVIPGLSTRSSTSSRKFQQLVGVKKASEDSSSRGNSWHESTEIENPNKNDDEELQSELQGVPDWHQEFKDGGHRAKDALAQPYLEQKIWVTC